MKRRVTAVWLVLLMLLFPAPVSAAAIQRPYALPTPVISDLEIVLVNGKLYLRYRTEITDAVKRMCSDVAAFGPSKYPAIDLWVQYKINDSDWMAFFITATTTDFLLKGESEYPVGSIPDALREAVLDGTGTVQLRQCYRLHDDEGQILSDWSNSISATLKDDADEQTESGGDEDEPDKDADGENDEGDADADEDADEDEDSDLICSDWAEEELARADEWGLIPDSLRDKDLTRPITRAEFAAVAVKTLEALSGTTALPSIVNPFTDTKDVEVLKAYNTGITNGTGPTVFSPDLRLSREQAATMLTRVFKRVTIPGWTLADDAMFPLSYRPTDAFADDADISDWAKNSVYFMAANGIITGMGNRIFAPKNTTTEQEARAYANATREQAILIALRMVENL